MDLDPPASDTPRLIGWPAGRGGACRGIPWGRAPRGARRRALLRESETRLGGAWVNYGPPLAPGGGGRVGGARRQRASTR